MSPTTPASTEDWKTWLGQAWTIHADEPERLAAALNPLAAAVPDDAETGAGALRLAEDLWVAHLGQPAALQDWLQRLSPHASLSPARARAQWVLDTLAGRPAPELPTTVRLRAMHSLAMGQVHRGDLAAARATLQSAAAVVDAGPDDAEALRGAAATAHNLSNSLRDLPRDAARDALMIEAATLAHALWSRTGQWMNIERADYQLALCLATCGHGERALRHATACLERCEAEGADAFERFFAHEVLVRSLQACGDAAAAAQHRRRMAELLPQIADEADRAWCRGTLESLPA